jgi:hypothetical protein
VQKSVICLKKIRKKQLSCPDEFGRHCFSLYSSRQRQRILQDNQYNKIQ